MMRFLRVVDRALARRLRGDLKVRFAENLRAARTSAGWSQTQLSERAGVRSQYISLIETGTANLKLETVARMARAVGQDPNRLLAGVFDTRAPDESGSAEP
jgi:transcriptional regulator with XRE-family HTH domain